MPGRPLQPIGATGKFPRTARVRRRREFVRIQDGGVRVHSSAFTIIAFPGEGEAAVARLGCAISRRVGNAVVRNRIRRLLKEIFRRRAKELPAVDFVVVAKPSAKTLADDGFESVQREFSEGLMNAVDRLARSEQKRRAPRERSDEPRGES